MRRRNEESERRDDRVGARLAERIKGERGSRGVANKTRARPFREG